MSWSLNLFYFFAPYYTSFVWERLLTDYNICLNYRIVTICLNYRIVTNLGKFEERESNSAVDRSHTVIIAFYRSPFVVYMYSTAYNRPKFLRNNGARRVQKLHLQFFAEQSIREPTPAKPLTWKAECLPPLTVSYESWTSQHRSLHDLLQCRRSDAILEELHLSMLIKVVSVHARWAALDFCCIPLPQSMVFSLLWWVPHVLSAALGRSTWTRSPHKAVWNASALEWQTSAVQAPGTELRQDNTFTYTFELSYSIYAPFLVV